MLSTAPIAVKVDLVEAEPFKLVGLERLAKRLPVSKAAGVLGKQVQLTTEDDQTTNPDAVPSSSSVCSLILSPSSAQFPTASHTMAPNILSTGKPLCFGCTDLKLTKMGNPWPSLAEVQLIAALAECAVVFKPVRPTRAPCGSSPRAPAPPSTGTRRRRTQ
jgi:hypothetical protein